MGLLDKLPPPTPSNVAAPLPQSTTGALAPAAPQMEPRPIPKDADEYSQRVVDAMTAMQLDAGHVSVGLLHQLEDHARKFVAATYERDKAIHRDAAIRIIADMEALAEGDQAAVAEGDQAACLDAINKRIDDLDSRLVNVGAAVAELEEVGDGKPTPKAKPKS